MGRTLRVGVLAHRAQVHDALQHQIGVAQVWHGHGDGSQATDLVLGGHGAGLPGSRRVSSATVHDQRQALTLVVFEVQGCPAVPLDDLTVLHIQGAQALVPVGQAGFIPDAQRCTRHGMVAAPLTAHRPVEEGQVRAGVPTASA
ncbi:hypothetical protein ACFSC4_08995 [Deinococcus malanensis]|uniref:hypothetical protein n=1 Tax=Deinococcus malanensis TaxID=1706855 RepID=UPI0036418FE0